jgi:teichuronic acid biosynthesis glycosyltransferase TuaG
MTQDAAVTIILPFKNAEAFLPETLASVQAQTFTSWRLVLIDDGSTDDSRLIASRFTHNTGGKKACIIDLKGVGVAEARNYAVRLAQTRYVAFLDADDVWTSDKLAVQLAAMQAHGAAFSYTAFKKLSRDSVVGPNEFSVPEAITYERLLAGNPIRCFTVVYDQFKLGPVLMPNIKMRNDLLAWLDVLRKLGQRAAPDSEVLPGALEPAGTRPILGINTMLGYYRQYSTSLTGNKLRAAKYQWIAYRDFLKLSIPRAAGYYLLYAMNGLRSYSSK